MGVAKPGLPWTTDRPRPSRLPDPPPDPPPSIRPSPPHPSPGTVRAHPPASPSRGSLLALEDIEVLALRMAESGCVSGRLAEWPLLARAFRAFGWEVPDTVGVSAMRGLARAALHQPEPWCNGTLFGVVR